MTPWELLEFRNCVESFYDNCNAALAEELDMRLDTLRQKGNECVYPVTKPLGDGLFELRAKSGTQQARLIFFYQANRKIIFVHAFKKSGSGKDKKEYRKALPIKRNIQAGMEKENVFPYTH